MERSCLMVESEGTEELLERTWTERLEKNFDTEDMRSRTMSWVLRSTPETPFRTLSETALTLATSSSNIKRSDGMRPMSSLAQARGTMMVSAPWSRQDINGASEVKSLGRMWWGVD
jgi:hypothetical protein